MEQLSERLQTPISTAELERRWAAVRAAMEREKIDVLLMQNNVDQMGGYVKYFTDLPANNGYPLTGRVSARRPDDAGEPGPVRRRQRAPGKSDGVRRGVKQWFTTPSYSSCYYTAPYDPELAAKALAPYAGGTIGLVGTYQMSFAMVDYMQKGRFSNTKFVDASDLVDRIKVIKSAEEQELVRRAARHAGRRHARGVRRRRARHARPRCRGHCAVLQPAPRQRARHLSVRLDASGQTGAIRAAPLSEPRHPGRRCGCASGRGCRPGRHVHRAWPHLRGRQGLRSR